VEECHRYLINVVLLSCHVYEGPELNHGEPTYGPCSGPNTSTEHYRCTNLPGPVFCTWYPALCGARSHFLAHRSQVS